MFSFPSVTNSYPANSFHLLINVCCTVLYVALLEAFLSWDIVIFIFIYLDTVYLKIYVGCFLDPGHCLLSANYVRVKIPTYSWKTSHRMPCVISPLAQVYRYRLLSCPVQSPACSTPASLSPLSVREGRSMDGREETDALAQKHIPSCAQR